MPAFDVVIHAGKHWPSKTFPKKWWDAVATCLQSYGGIKPVLIGANIDEGRRGYVDMSPEGCIDFRDKLTIRQSLSILQKAKVVLTNDSAPFHMAASGNAWIGVFSTVRHFDYIVHWGPDYYSNKNEWAYKMQDLALGHMWRDDLVSPATNGSKHDVIDQPTLESWLKNKTRLR